MSSWLLEQALPPTNCVTLGKIHILLPNLSSGNSLGVRAKVNIWKELRTHGVTLLEWGEQNNGPLKDSTP